MEENKQLTQTQLEEDEPHETYPVKFDWQSITVLIVSMLMLVYPFITAYLNKPTPLNIRDCFLKRKILNFL